MKRVLSWILGVPVALIVIVVVVANRGLVVFSLDPFDVANPWLAFEMPLYALLVATIILGMLIGGASAWLSQGKWRREARHRRHEVRRLQSERDVPRETALTAPAPLQPL